MRVSNQRPTGRAPYAISFSSLRFFITDDDGDKIPFENTLSTDMIPPQSSSNISETFNDKIWEKILPGLERVCIILRSQDYSHAEIAWIIGMKTDEVSRVLYKVKNRLKKQGINQDPETL